MKRRTALLALGAATLLPMVGPERQGAAVIRNDPREWGRWWTPRELCCVNPFFPRDGRESIYRPYERFAQTDTVGAYLDISPYLGGAPQSFAYRGLPADFDGYLRQRIASIDYLRNRASPADKIDAFGNIVPA